MNNNNNRSVKSLQGLDKPAVEMYSLYFDNPKMRPMAYNLAINTSMWVAVQTTETAYRKALEKMKHPNRSNAHNTAQPSSSSGMMMSGTPQMTDDLHNPNLNTQIDANNDSDKRGLRFGYKALLALIGAITFVTHKKMKK